MATTVVSIAEPELAAYISHANAEYLDERMRAGDSREYAEQRVAESNEQYFPGGRPAAGHQVLRVVHDGDPVGWLWLGPMSAEHPLDWWVFDVEIDEQHRGKGLGRAAMLLAEKVARAAGAVKLGLNVFGHNTVAQRLYSTLGYEVTAINMSKQL